MNRYESEQTAFLFAGKQDSTSRETYGSDIIKSARPLSVKPMSGAGSLVNLDK